MAANSPDQSEPASVELDELMMAMDVVDTLRHEDRLLQDALSETERDRALKKRLRSIYEGQGLAVTDEILDEGIRALKENRFVYDPPPPSLQRTMALLWIKRRPVGLALGAVLALVVLVGVWQSWSSYSDRAAERAAANEIGELLPARLSAIVGTAHEIADTDEARAEVDAIAKEAKAALAAGDADSARALIDRAKSLSDDLRRHYDVRIVKDPDSPSGVFRIPDANEDAKNYYLIVEALDRDGTPLERTITSEEDGTTKTVTRWGLRVPEATFEAVKRDKLDDGVLHNDVVGTKRVGALRPDWTMPVEGGTITSW